MTKTSSDIIGELIRSNYQSLREFSRAIQEDGRDISIWRDGKRKITARAVIKICELHPNIKPHDLNPLVFPAYLKLVFDSSLLKMPSESMDTTEEGN